MNNGPVVLGIHDGHNSSACLMAGGRVLAAVSEERISRMKNECGYPARAVECVMKQAGISGRDLDGVALASRFMHHREFFYNWEWYRKGAQDQVEDASREPQRRQYLLGKRQQERVDEIVHHVGCSADKITIQEHHSGHASAAYYASGWAFGGEKVLVLTLDGSGDGVCGTVSIGENGAIRRLAQTGSAASLGKIYSRLTFLMGMKPWEHEYKLMGLAPYADPRGQAKSYDVLSKLVVLDEGSLTFRTGTDLSTNYCYPYLRTNLENHRFDWIAGAAQQLVEERVVQWVRTALAATSTTKVVCGGGVFMNVKVNMLISELPEVEAVFTFPSCGDESLCFGSAYAETVRLAELRGGASGFDGLDSAYLGPSFDDADVEAALQAHPRKFHVVKHPSVDTALGNLLAKKYIVARINGRMEWGARALGNRSILMDPRHTRGVRELNAAIKQRDFWMPFAPSVLESSQSDFIENPKNLKSPFMMTAFRTTPEGEPGLAAATHPYDGTARAQLVDSVMNPGYHRLISRFRERTGVGAVLNTSLNIHGEPIVCTPSEGLSTLERSSLPVMAIGDYLISKQPVAGEASD